jgi:hypothetical protein
MTDDRKRRDRDVYVPKTPAPGTPIFVEEECTGKYDGEDLATHRSRRPTPERISRLEAKHDQLGEKVNEIHGDVREMKGALTTALDFIKLKETESGKTTRTRITTNGKILIGIIGAAITTIGTVLVAYLA